MLDFDICVLYTELFLYCQFQNLTRNMVTVNPSKSLISARIDDCLAEANWRFPWVALNLLSGF
jgi:hypothetical protein